MGVFDLAGIYQFFASHVVPATKPSSSSVVTRSSRGRLALFSNALRNVVTLPRDDVTRPEGGRVDDPGGLAERRTTDSWGRRSPGRAGELTDPDEDPVLSEARVCPYRHQGGHRGRFLLCFYARLLVLGMVKSALVIGHCFLRLARVPVLQALGSSGVKFGYCSRRGCSHRGVWGQFGLVAGGILEWGARRFLPFDRLALFSVGLLLVLWPLSRRTYYNTILCLNAVLFVAGVAQALVRYLAERFRLRPRCGQASREHPEAAGHTWRRGGDAELRHGAKRPCRRFQWTGALAGSWGLLRIAPERQYHQTRSTYPTVGGGLGAVGGPLVFSENNCWFSLLFPLVVFDLLVFAEIIVGFPCYFRW